MSEKREFTANARVRVTVEVLNPPKPEKRK